LSLERLLREEIIMKRNSIIIFGLGELGGYTLEFLARVPNIPKIVAVDVREDWGVRKTNGAIVGASQFGLYPDIHFVNLDIFDVDKTTKLLKEVEPTIVFNAMVLQSWWVITKLPSEAHKAIDEAQFGPWFPMQFVPAYKLMQAVKRSGINTHVLNAGYPDLVNPALGKIGLAPTTGIGNIDNTLSQSRLVISKMFKVPLRSVTVYMVLHHFVNFYMTRYGSNGGAPFYLKVLIDDKERKINQEEFLANLTTMGKRPVGIANNPVVASSACKIIMGILLDTKELGHAPGPNGLPGGYPIKLSSEGVEVFVPEGLTLEKAIRINEEGQAFDGVESIEDDGSVVITDKSAEIFKKLLDFDCKVYKVEEVESKAKELDEKYREWAKAQKQ
jgi:hypothetical protein